AAVGFVVVAAEAHRALQDQFLVLKIKHLEQATLHQRANLEDAAPDHKLRAGSPCGSDEIVRSHADGRAGMLRTIERQHAVVAFRGKILTHELSEMRDAGLM